MCDFVAKSKTNLQVHVKAKHQESSETETFNLEPEIVVLEENEESVLIEDTGKDLENQMEQEETAFEIKLEVFVLVLNDDEDVFKVRDNLMKKLEENEEVEKVTKVYVHKSDTFIDEDNLKWHTVDVTLTSAHNSKVDRYIFQKTYFSKLLLMGHLQ